MDQRCEAKRHSHIHHNTSSVTDMLHTLGWTSLEHRRATSRLCMLLQIYHASIGIPHDPYILPYRHTPRPSRQTDMHTLATYQCRTNYYWNGQLVWTPALGHYLCVARRGPGTVSSGIYRPPFCAVGTNVRRWLSYSHWQAYIHYAFIRQMASFLVSDSLTLGV